MRREPLLQTGCVCVCVRLVRVLVRVCASLCEGVRVRCEAWAKSLRCRCSLFIRALRLSRGSARSVGVLNLSCETKGVREDGGETECRGVAHEIKAPVWRPDAHVRGMLKLQP
jgi:hypothetical protein